MESLFSYGTLQKPEVQLKLFGRAFTGRRDTARGYKLSAITIDQAWATSRNEQTKQVIAIFSDDPLDHIRGTVFEISTDELLMADRYEPAEYERVEVKLASGKKAWMYAGREQPGIGN